MATFSSGPVTSPYNPASSFDVQGAIQDGQKTQGNALALVGAQQDQVDRQTFRDNAAGLIAKDPTATAQALGANPTASQAYLNSIPRMDENTRAQSLSDLQMSAAAAGSVLNLPANQRAAGWATARQSLIAGGHTNVPPEAYPGDAAMQNVRNMGLSVEQQFGLTPQYPSVDPQPILGTTPGKGTLGPQGGTFQQRLGMSESSNTPSNVNPQGYVGTYQFGASRLADLGMYQPAQGESPKANSWQGQFNIPGFPNVKTLADFRASPDAQNAAYSAHMGNIDQAIAGTPGTQGMNQDGLRAVAHLGGVGGMQQFVATKGGYNPSDKLGTSLQAYYNKFSASSGDQQQAQNGPTPAPAGQQQAPAAAPVQQQAAAAQPAVAGGTPAVSAPVQVADMTGTTGLPVTANDAVPAGPSAPTNNPATAPTLPVGGSLQASAPARGQSQPVIAPQPTNALAQVGAGSGASQPVANPFNTIGAPAPASVPQQGAQAAPALQGRPLLDFKTHLPIPVPGRPGYMMMQTPDGKQFEQRIPGDPGMGVDTKIVGGHAISTDKLDGRLISDIPGMPDDARMTAQQVPGGTQMYQSGHAVGGVIPFSGRAEQKEAYAADLPQVQALTAAGAQAQANMPRLNELASLVSQAKTGGLAPEARAKAATVLESMGVPADAIKNLTGMASGSVAQEIMKLGISVSGAAAKADVGSNNGIQSISLYQAANPGMNLLPDANKRITNMLRVAAQSTQDYAQGALQSFGDKEGSFLKGGDYTPMTTFNRQWQAQSNPQVYAAATGMLNGDTFDKWSKGLSPEEAQRAGAIAARIDRNAQIPGRNGMVPASKFLPAAQ